ncbi:kunitz-type protease inhibitor 2 [Synchiropus splendidus]|uniref:kunitz-type protease inhibitor 2 n=1 Tax=Synchiropus splendidus TaxID=270530 RepID=UPI00237E1732|nr:kunitz-type protease inhibitor 2 [Synchiropus splendidus]
MRVLLSLICLLVACEPGWTGSARTCRWNSDLGPKQGLSPQSPAQELRWSNETDPGRCRDLCCSADDCDLALVAPSGSGAPRCGLVRCPLRGCLLEPSERFLVYQRLKIVPFSNPPSSEVNTTHCWLPMKVGRCRAAFPRFYYDVTSKTCRRFTYGGCGGNGNNFASQEECEALCGGDTGSEAARAQAPGSPAAVTQPPSQKAAALCSGAPDAGPCRAAFPMFYYDGASGTCHSFIYGGCRGNLNRHASLEECLNRCREEGSVDSRGQLRNRWTAAFFLLLTLAGVSALLVAALIVVAVRRRLPPGAPASLSDKAELLQDPDEPSQDSLAVPPEA